ncbi:MAG: type II toxin-antitoxin system RelE/ParE family toxin [Candidatus Gracilibacteria bacterium]|nr:type II toxin-antitoxin system RelE/ParE family toxin [Candidatus Gracilibacteria bacterium]
MYNIEFQESADENLDFIFSYIAEDNGIVAIKVINKINQTIQNLRLFPYMGKPYFELMREIVEPKYKFRILYKIVGNNIFIVSITKNTNSF